MNVLLVNVPSRRGKGGRCLPLGLLYVGAIIERCGHKVRIFDPYLHDVELGEGWTEGIEGMIDKFGPSIVGFGGIATSYGRTKSLSALVKKKYPGILQIAGGALSSVSDLLLTKTAVDVVFHGETEVSLPEFLEVFEKKNPLEIVPGISYLEGTRLVSTTPAEQIEDLDKIPFPAYHLVELEKYFGNITDWFAVWNLNIETNLLRADIVARLGGRKHYMSIVSSRGCTHRCLFCFRHMRGHRQHSVAYIINHLNFLKNRYGVEGFQFGDELFNANRSWVMEFCDAIERENIDIFYIIGGARVDMIDEQMLIRLKETGCIEIGYGQESGSDRILKEYRKGVCSKQNKDITRLTTKTVGIHSPVQLVIGSPGETNQTIYETIQFLKDVEAYEYSLNYLIPLPGTPIWQYIMENKLINNVEEYLDHVSEYGGTPLLNLNLTKMPDRIWKNWHYVIRKELEIYYCKKRDLRFRLVYRLIFLTVLPFMPQWFKRFVKQVISLCKGEKGKSIV